MKWLAVWLLSALTVWADSFEQGDQLFAEAVSIKTEQPRHARQLFERAAHRYERAADNADLAAAAWYNAGNARFFSHDYGEAVYCYRKALTCDPGQKLVAANLNYVRGLVHGSAVPDIWEGRSLPLWWNLWALASLLLWVWLYRRLWHAGGRCWPGFVLLLCWLIPALQLLRGQPDIAVVVRAGQVARMGPGAVYSAALTLPPPAGAECKVLERRAGWLLLKWQQGTNPLWLPESAVREL